MRFHLKSSTIIAVCLFVHVPAAYAQDHDHHDHGHHHHHEAPHGGTMIALGDEAAHLELVLDSAKGHLTGYVLDGEGVKSIRINQTEIPLQITGDDITTTLAIALKPVANPLTGEKVGDTSQFQATTDTLKNKKTFTVTIPSITIRDINFKNTKSKFPEGNH